MGREPRMQEKWIRSRHQGTGGLVGTPMVEVEGWHEHCAVFSSLDLAQSRPSTLC